MEVTITDETLKQNLSEAILASLGGATQQAIIKDAIADLVAERFIEKTHYGGKEERPSKIQEMFGDAVERHARRLVYDLVENDPEVKGAVETFVKNAVITLLTDKDKALSDAIATAMRSALMKISDPY